MYPQGIHEKSMKKPWKITENPWKIKKPLRSRLSSQENHKRIQKNPSIIPPKPQTESVQIHYKSKNPKESEEILPDHEEDAVVIVKSTQVINCSNIFTLPTKEEYSQSRREETLVAVGKLSSSLTSKFFC